MQIGENHTWDRKHAGSKTAGMQQKYGKRTAKNMSGSIVKRLVSDQEGNAMIMVLAVIIILLAFGSLTLTLSLNNVKISAKYQNWSKEFYDLDNAVDKRVAEFDGVLSIAEKITQCYMQNQLYEYERLSDIPVLDETAASIKLTMSQNAQDFFHTRWALVQGNPEDYPIEDFIKEAFERLYFYYSAKLLEDKSGIDDEFDSIKYTDTLIPIKDYRSLDDAAIRVWEDYGPSEGDIKFMIEAVDSVSGKKVVSALDVIVPDYKTVVQKKYTPQKGNPVWTYALAAGENIVFNGTSEINIFGDIISSSRSIGSRVSEADREAGVYSTGADVNIYGNLYARGNVNSNGSFGSINVYKYAKALTDKSEYISVEAKNKIFSENRLFFDDSGMSIIKPYTQDYTNTHYTDYVPFVFSDIEGGNVYCNSLTVADGVENSSVYLQGNLWTLDDVQMDGRNSKIIINGTYIGLRSDAGDGEDPNNSSSIINNSYDKGGIISLGSQFVVPGTAFRRFDGTTAVPPNLFYQTAESVSSSNPEIFSIYMNTLEAGPGTYVFDDYYINMDDGSVIVFTLIRFSNLSDKINHMTDYFNFTGDIPETGIMVPGTVNGYSLGASIVKREGGKLALTRNSGEWKWAANQLAYNTLKGWLKDIFDMKTMYLGTKDLTFTGPDSKLVDKSVTLYGTENVKVFAGGGLHQFTMTGFSDMIYSEGDISLVLDGHNTGIVYSKGDVTLKGTGTFRGTIISEGNIRISGDIKICYDESVIINLLKSSDKIRKFFSPSSVNMGSPVYYTVEESIDPRGGERSSSFKKRYKIRSWEEMQN